MKAFLDKYQAYFNIFFIISIILLCLFFIFLLSRVNNISSQIVGLSRPTETSDIIQATPSVSDYCGPECKNEISKTVSSAISTLSGSTKTIIQKETVSVPTPTRITYIPLGGPVTTTSLTWTDAAGTDVYIDLANDYGAKAKISWDANLSVMGGQVSARLYDVTHNITVEGSEISITEKSSLTNVGSANFTVWSGRNLYRVQFKSLNSSIATFGSGRIKIVY